VLLRPDGHVAYRAHSLPTDPEHELRAALNTARGATPTMALGSQSRA
jgi:hypothetical protein